MKPFNGNRALRARAEAALRAKAARFAEAKVLPGVWASEARRVGLDPYEIETAAMTVSRADTLRWVDGLKTKNGSSRGARVASCGHLRAAKLVDGPEIIYGLAHAWCKDRACKGCAHRRAQKLRAYARAHLAALLETSHRLDHVVVTLTQVKRHAREESADQTLDRLLNSRRYLNSGSRTLRARFRAVVAGMMWATEVTWSPAGAVRNHSDTAVKYDGWHAHYHCFVHLQPRPVDFDGSDHAWREHCQRELVDVWSEASAKASRVNARELLASRDARAFPRRAPYSSERLDPFLEAGRRGEPSAEFAQRFGELSEKTLHQQLKYPFKGAFDTGELVEDGRAREAFRALEKRRLHMAWGTWRGWLDADVEDDGQRIELAQAKFQDVVLAAQADAFVRWQPWGAKYATDAVPARQILESVQEHGCTLQVLAARRRQARAEGSAEPSAEVSAEPSASTAIDERGPPAVVQLDLVSRGPPSG